MVDIRSGARLRTKMSAELAAQLTEKCIGPIASKIDPLTLGEHQRAMQIALEYGQRLGKMSGNLDEEALERLIASYPCHGFVIDRKEAKDLFKKVNRPEGTNEYINLWSRSLCRTLDLSDLCVLNVAERILKDSPMPDSGTDVTSTDEEQKT